MARLILVLTIVLLALTGCSYGSLEKAIQNKWDTVIKVLYVDEEHKSVIFQDNPNNESDGGQYIYSTYKKLGSSYRYSTIEEEGYSFNAQDGLTPFLFLWHGSEEKTGNVIWGVVRSEVTIKEIIVTCTKKNSEVSEVKFSIPVHNQVFIYYPEYDFRNGNESSQWTIKAEALDENGKVIATSGY